MRPDRPLSLGFGPRERQRPTMSVGRDQCVNQWPPRARRGDESSRLGGVNEPTKSREVANVMSTAVATQTEIRPFKIEIPHHPQLAWRR